MMFNDFSNHPLYWMVIGIIIYIMIERFHGDRIRGFINIYYEEMVAIFLITIIIIDMMAISIFSAMILMIPITHLNLGLVIEFILVGLITTWSLILFLCMFKMIGEVVDPDNKSKNVHSVSEGE